MKKIINSPETLVLEMCGGLIAAHPELALIPRYKIVKRKTLNANKVTLICGGGSGHEPAHAGLVGVGLLDAAVCGDVFASPSQVQVYAAIKATAGEKGTLLIVKNYSGDMMNFQNAMHMALEDGVSVDFVKVDDDIAVEDSLYTVGRRGVAGTVFVHKIAGAAAEAGWPLAEVKRAAQKTAENVRSIGFALTSCTVPAKGTPTFALGPDEMEYGVGIHGEPGIRREKVSPANVLAKRMVAALLEELSLSGGQEAALLINGFGGTPLQELYVLNHCVRRELACAGVTVARTLVGNFMTSIDMAGASISLLKLDDELKGLLNEPCHSPALKVHGPDATAEYTEVLAPEETEDFSDFGCKTDGSYAAVRDNVISRENIVFLVDKMGEVIISNEVAFCELDSHAGDGDFGMSVSSGFKQLKREWEELTANRLDSIGPFLDACALVIMEHCGGASGPIWGAAFRAAGKQAGSKKALTCAEFADVLAAAVKGVQDMGARCFGRGAVKGDKTLIDALAPCAECWAACAAAGVPVPEAFAKGAEAAVIGAESTKNIVARMGRAGTVGQRSLGHPDAGAYALGVIFTKLAESLYE